MLQLLPGLVTGPPDLPSEQDGSGVPQHRAGEVTSIYDGGPCPLGVLTTRVFAMSFLTAGERHGMLYQIGDSIDRLGMSFHDILVSGWPLFGLLARLSEEIGHSGGHRPVDACHSTDKVREEIAERVAQGQPVPEELAWNLVHEIGSVSSRTLPEDAQSGCALGLAAAWASLADTAFSDSAFVAKFVNSAEASLRTFKSNYTHLDWLSSRWPVFQLLHRLQFSPGVFYSGPPPDLVPREASTGRPLRFAFNRDLERPDPLYIDVAANIQFTEFMRSFPRYFGVQAANSNEQWDLNLVYTSNEYEDLVPSRDLLRLRSRSQKLMYVPNMLDVVGEKDQQCRIHREALNRWSVLPSFDKDIGGLPTCFTLPDESREFRAFVETEANGMEAHRQAFVRKPEGMWGGRGIEIRYGVEDLVDDDVSPGSCAFAPLDTVQCLGLRSAGEAASLSEDTCRRACCAEDEGPDECATWNWREGDGCWIGIARACSGPSPTYLGGWRGGHRLKGDNAMPRAVVQRYILDPVLYMLDVQPPVIVKTDIRVYGTVISMDPLRVYVSRYGYFRSGYLEKNYSVATDADLKESLMHITHHIPKIEAGTFQCPKAPSWGDPEDAEQGSGGGSGGSLHRWLQIAKEQNGLDPRAVWENVKLVVGLFMLEVRAALNCHANPTAFVCDTVGFHFFADLVVDSRGRAWMVEVHPTLAVKGHGLGDPEAGWVEVLTRATRQGSMGSLAMFFAEHMNVPYRRWAELVVRRLLRQSRWRAEVSHLSALHGRERIGRSKPRLADLLARMLVEEHMACRLAVEPILPLGWRRLAHYVRRKTGSDNVGADRQPGPDPFSVGLRSFYRLLDAARSLVRRLRMAGLGPRNDLRPKRCTAVDFNAGGVWDQPWERTSRRFKV